MIANRRFYETVTAEQCDGGYALLLDGRGVKTPAMKPLVLPTELLAGEIAAEWAAQGERILTQSMPLTCLAHTAIDQLEQGRDAIVDTVASYGGSDLLCYWAVSPEELKASQEAQWQPWLDWVQRRYKAPLKASTGVMPHLQEPATLAALRSAVDVTTPWELAALGECVTLTGSLVLGLAILDGELDGEAAWQLARIDEDYQTAHWGRDADAEAAAQKKQAALAVAVNFLTLSRV